MILFHNFCKVLHILALMISINYSQIPDYLHNSSFFQALSVEEGDGEIQIPEQCFSRDGQVNTTDDFARLLRVADFWGLSIIPTGLIEFCIDSRTSRLSHLRIIIEAEFSTISFAQDLRNIFMPDPPGSLHYPLVKAIVVNRPEVVCHLAHKVDCGLQATAAAAGHGHLAILQLLHRHGHPWDESAFRVAAVGGHLECLQYLHMNGCPWNESVCYVAAIRGHLKCLRYLHEKGCPWNYMTLLGSADGGQFDCMIYVHEQGLEWIEETTRILSKNGSVGMLKYAVEHGCMYGYDCALVAASNGHINCLRYLHEVGCDINGWGVVEKAIECGRFDCLPFLVEHGYVTHEAYARWVEYWGSLPTVKIVQEND